MSKKIEPTAAAGEPTAPADADTAASPAQAKPTLADRVRALEVKAFGHAPHDKPAGE